MRARLAAVRALCLHSVRPAVLIARPATGERPRVCGCGLVRSAGCLARLPSVRSAGLCARSAAGITWTSRTLAAPWAARDWHTSVIDAAGAIYVIGGYTGLGGTGFFQDGWVSTDGGARAGLRRGGGRGVHWAGTQGVLTGTKVGLRGTEGYYMGY